MEGWARTTLKDICVVDWGNTNLTKSSYVDDGDYLAVSAAGCDGRIGHAEHKMHTPVLSAIGAQCGRMFFPDEDFTAIKNTITLTPKLDAVDPKFLFYLLNSIELPKRGAGQPFISKGDIQKYSISVPPLPEQKHIVAILDEAFEGIDKAIANTEKNLANARELFDVCLEGLISKKDESDRKVLLSEACDRITVGHVGSMAKEYQDAGIPFLRSQNIRPFKLDMAGLKFVGLGFHSSLKKSSLKPGDVAIVRTGYPGTAAVIPKDLGEANCSDLVIATPGRNLVPEYLAMILNSPFGRSTIAGNLTGAAQKHFNVTAAKNVEITLPSLEVQHQRIERLSELGELTDAAQQALHTKRRLLDRLREGVLTQAFSGQLIAPATLTEAAE